VAPGETGRMIFKFVMPEFNGLVGVRRVFEKLMKKFWNRPRGTWFVNVVLLMFVVGL
jgi:hypothetical protein